MRIFDPLRQAAALIFKRDLALRRDAGGVHIVLEAVVATPAKPAKVMRAEASDRRQREELTLILKQLKQLLDEMPESRQTLRHLVFVEQALVKKGLRALHKLPLDVLQRALEQLEGLVTNWSPVGLANLRSKMAVAVLDREHQDPQAEGDAYRTAAVLDTAPEQPKEEPESTSEAEALAAAYAALGAAAPIDAPVQMQPELGARSAHAVAPANRSSERSGPLALRELHT
ncbi:hypothetical protein [Rubrivivax sp. A210]|uniref:hypothetical protein n=1 Tax=Rubrivivax sp. A210 TaxID=2772301 RepID=UPI00191A375C|nr:hypothetical protein [Rubrivivax sp. A210]